MEIELFCPYHLKDELLELPDSYRYFQGEIECSPPPGEPPINMKVWIIRGLLVDVAPV